MGDALGTFFGHRDTPSVEVMRAKVSIGLGLDFEKEIIPSRCRFFAPPPVRAPKSDEDEALEKMRSKSQHYFWGRLY